MRQKQRVARWGHDGRGRWQSPGVVGQRPSLGWGMERKRWLGTESPPAPAALASEPAKAAGASHEQAPSPGWCEGERSRQWGTGLRASRSPRSRRPHSHKGRLPTLTLRLWQLGALACPGLWKVKLSADGNSPGYFHGCAYDTNTDVLRHHEAHYGNETKMSPEKCPPSGSTAQPCACRFPSSREH